MIRVLVVDDSATVRHRLCEALTEDPGIEVAGVADTGTAAIELARTLRPGGPFVCTFSNRCFPTKAIRGWLATTDEQHCDIVAHYFRAAGAFDEPVAERRAPSAHRGDPLFAVWARRSA